MNNKSGNMNNNMNNNKNVVKGGMNQGGISSNSNMG